MGKLVDVQKESFVTQGKADVGSGVSAVGSSSVFPISGNIYPDGYAEKSLLFADLIAEFRSQSSNPALFS